MTRHIWELKMQPSEYLDNLFRSLPNRNKWDSWNLIFRICDCGHCKMEKLYEVGGSLGYSKKHIDIRRKQYLEKLTPNQKRYKKRFANKR